MRKIAILFVALQVSVLSLFAADTPKECTLCVGATADLTAPPSAVIPLLLQITENDLATTPDRYAFSARSEQSHLDRRLFRRSGQGSAARCRDAHEADRRVGAPSWSVRRHRRDSERRRYHRGRLRHQTPRGDGARAQRRDKIVLPPTTIDDLNKLSETGALNYIDALIVSAPDVAKANAWIMDKEPSKKLYATVEPQSPNAFFDLARALADGATRAFTTRPAAEDVVALANFNSAFAGDWAFDATSSHPGSRRQRQSHRDAGADVRSRRRSPDDHRSARRRRLRRRSHRCRAIATRGRAGIDAAGDRQVTDVGAKGGHFLIGVQPVKHPFLLTLDHTEKPQITKEAISVQTSAASRSKRSSAITRRTRRIRSRFSRATSRATRRNLRFTLEGGEAIEATISGRLFLRSARRRRLGVAGLLPQRREVEVRTHPGAAADSAGESRRSFRSISTSRTNIAISWSVRRICNGYHTYEVRFEPPPNAPAGPFRCTAARCGSTARRGRASASRWSSST